ncbi:MAG TPA: hypothetical protein PK331_09330 [Gordonia sp. (in: high G+C Gram-positive bacteria)]|uniref:major capsid protein n=1 Tax=unclassified Gordonia (in: high G+C Gram-positive bacteria) TaxID=2657482 RepID=UPI000FB1F3B5|nr:MULTISPECIES: major capsid protein [unclassified Gordonia (in: high G+C Gram-positive bacteria)]RUP35631.1 MAG: hypothetical protein EKK60_17230 [Gordonia sp. (in: high G+C Gram-positive bacteria)]HNP57508.1 hypothetical protein [Gordonia sp. (in: high G+C Gram-positive bacteria)]HRC51107.1 hypothetical protein [Gordonia sp. (in: high G+C Gram-positive bacteria)]
MTSSLVPKLDGRNLTVDVALKQPTIIRDRIARLADDQILLPHLFHGLGKPVEGGGLLYTVTKNEDLYTSDVETRAPGDEYKVVEGTDPEVRKADLADWGGKFQVFDEARRRNDVDAVDQQTTQLANTITRRLDKAVVDAINAAVTGDNIVPGNDWTALQFADGAEDVTPTSERPTADFSAAQLAADLQQLGVRHDLLLVGAEAAHHLRVAYAEKLAGMLDSAGLKLVVNPQIPTGQAWVAKAGEVGVVGFEQPLTVITWRDEATRSTWVQCYVVPAVAVNRPHAMKKLTGLAG